MRYLLILCLLLVSMPVWACESYEECINAKAYYYEKSMGGPIPMKREEMQNLATIYLKAIAYKLDEISKQMKESTR